MIGAPNNSNLHNSIFRCFEQAACLIADYAPSLQALPLRLVAGDVQHSSNQPQNSKVICCNCQHMTAAQQLSSSGTLCPNTKSLSCTQHPVEHMSYDHCCSRFTQGPQFTALQVRQPMSAQQGGLAAVAHQQHIAVGSDVSSVSTHGVHSTAFAHVQWVA